MAEMIKKFKFFSIADYEAEEQYLKEMSAQGYHLTKIEYPGFYYFEKGAPKNFTYALDLNSGEQAQDLIQLAKDYGWSHIFNYVEWNYFRKEGDGHQFFTDKKSKMQLLLRIVTTRYLVILFIFLLTTATDFFSIIFVRHFKDARWYEYSLVVLGSIYLLFLIFQGYKLIKLYFKYRSIK